MSGAPGIVGGIPIERLAVMEECVASAVAGGHALGEIGERLDDLGLFLGCSML